MGCALSRFGGTKMQKYAIKPLHKKREDSTCVNPGTHCLAPFIRYHFYRKLLPDITMPGMDGWEFMEAYKLLDEKYQVDVIVVMLTTSINPDDRKKWLELTGLSDFMNKPLTRQQFTTRIEKNFPKLAEEIRAANPG